MLKHKKIEVKNDYFFRFEPESQYGAFYTGGLVEWTSDGEQFLCQDVGKINIISITEGIVVKTLGGSADESLDEDVIYTFALSLDDESIVTAHKSGLLKLWNKTEGVLKKMWKGIHQGPISRLSFNSNNKYIASGGSDSTVRIWDFEHKVCMAALKGCVGVISVVGFHPDPDQKIVFAAGDDTKINLWNYNTREIIMTLSGHFSKITSISYSIDNNYLVSSSRDKVVILWNLETKAQERVLPMYEGIETALVLPSGIKLPDGQKLSKNKMYVATAGELGVIRIWDISAVKCIYQQTNSLISKPIEEGGLAITQLIFNTKTSQIAVISADHNILIHDIKSFNCTKQLIGFSDEILDIVFVGKKDRYLAVATNSPDIKIYDTTDMNCQILKGHTDLVLALASTSNYLLSSSKDNSIRLWKFESGEFNVKCVAIGTRHTGSVGSVAFSKMSKSFCASVSQDTCLKTWKIPQKFDSEEIQNLTCISTAISHENDVNCVSISPNDKMIATASQDKTAKLWESETLSLLGVFRGHRRGVWSVRFSPVDQVLLTASVDTTMKLWSLTDMTCLKTIEGHESSVLRVEFITNGTQILSAGADGLIKVWSIKTSECCATLDKHDSRVWAMAITSDENNFYSGGSDSQLVKWKDVTEEKRIKEFEEKNEVVLQEQELNNLISQKKMLKALRLALRLERPFLTLKIINSVIKTQETGLKETINKLNDLHKETLIKHASTWNTNSRNCIPAQLVLNIIMSEILSGDFKPPTLDKLVEQLLPFTDRHFKRMTEYMIDVKFVEYTLKCMQPHANLNDME